MSTSKMRFGLIGAGAIAQTYAQSFLQSTTATVVGVADVRRDAAQALADRLQCPAFDSYQAMVYETECESAVVCTPPVTHPDIACWLLSRRIPVLCEKPLAINPQQARLMVDAAERSAT